MCSFRCQRIVEESVCRQLYSRIFVKNLILRAGWLFKNEIQALEAKEALVRQDVSKLMQLRLMRDTCRKKREE